MSRNDSSMAVVKSLKKNPFVSHFLTIDVRQVLIFCADVKMRSTCRPLGIPCMNFCHVCLKYLVTNLELFVKLLSFSFKVVGFPIKCLVPIQSRCRSCTEWSPWICLSGKFDLWEQEKQTWSNSQRAIRSFIRVRAHSAHQTTALAI